MKTHNPSHKEERTAQNLSWYCSPSFISRCVWLCRIIVGATFIVSGLAKLIDLWGTIFKIEDYAAVWDIAVPRTVIMMGALMLSTFEFISGLLLLTGCYRRIIPWGLMLVMLFMLPLTAYIWYADPVPDCGCFGDFLILSNAMTFWKNVVLVILIIYLIKHNRQSSNIFLPPVQWLILVTGSFYCIIIALAGYNIQPLIDFREFKAGTPLLPDENEETDNVVFIYEKDGHRAQFDIDSLPDDDSGWEYVDRKSISSTDAAHHNLDVYDPETGDLVTEDYLAGADSLLLLIIPEPARADLSYTYTINELADVVTRQGGQVVALLDAQSRGIERWKDHSMASYSCFTAEDTQLKELARGVMSMVWVREDTIRWKRTVSSINLEDVDLIKSGQKSMSSLDFDGATLFWKLTLGTAGVLLVIYIFQVPYLAMRARHNRRLRHKEHKNQVAHSENLH